MMGWVTLSASAACDGVLDHPRTHTKITTHAHTRTLTGGESVQMSFSNAGPVAREYSLHMITYI